MPYREEVMHLYKHKDSPDVTSLADLFSQDFTAGINRGSFLVMSLNNSKPNIQNRSCLLLKQIIDLAC
ncbi:hypothetical protein P4S63_19385 [Pseudoalteromonas sp. B193]